MKRRISVAVIAILTIGSAAADAAEKSQVRLNEKLHGDYSLVSQEQCVGSASGFGPAPNFQALGAVTNLSTVALGTQLFNGDGTFSTTVHAQSASTPPTDGSPAFPISESNVVCTGTYVVHADDTVDMDSSCSGSQVAGRFAGLLTTVSSPTHYKGRLLGKALHAAHLTAVVSATEIKIAPSYQATTYAICSGNSISKKIPARDSTANTGSDQ